LKPFPSVAVQQEEETKIVMDYSNFEVDGFETRTKATHLNASELYKSAANSTERDEIKKTWNIVY
jgi:hypothetical protein